MKQELTAKEEEAMNIFWQHGPQFVKEMIAFYDDPKQQIEGDYNPEAIKELSLLAEAFADDHVTRALIEKWIGAENEHMAWEAQYLGYINKLGYENFLIAMM